MTLAPNFAVAIAAMCAQYQGMSHDACEKAIDAGTRQIGFRQQVDKAQDKVNEIVDKKVHNIVGETVSNVVGTGAYAARIAREKKVSFRLPNLGLANSINNEVGVDSYKIILQWNW